MSEGRGARHEEDDDEDRMKRMERIGEG